jgi:hypothetical protein
MSPSEPALAADNERSQPRSPSSQLLSFEGLSQRERSRLRLLALSYRVRQDTTLRPWADVVFDLRLQHGIRLSMGQVLELVGRRAEQ